MQNGDRYVGKVLSLSSNAVVLQSEVLGIVHLPRGKVTTIALATNALTNVVRLPSATNGLPHAPAPTVTNANSELDAALRQLGANTNLIKQVQGQFLAGAGPEATDKFNELLGGVLSGKLTVNDIRAEAQTVADQLRALQRETGEDNGWVMNGYLAILDHFLKETAPAGSPTNAPARPKTEAKEK